MKDLRLQNKHKMKGCGDFVRKALPLTDRIKRPEAKKELELSLDVGEEFRIFG